MFTLDQVRCFVAVAEELHFGRAAERLNMTQPPLSRQIQKLERAVGVELLERDNRSVALTPAGEAFLDNAKRLLSSAERSVLTARRFAAGLNGELRIGFTAASAFNVLGSTLDRLSRALPKVHLELFEMVSRDQLAALQTGELDIGLVRPPIDTQQFNSLLMQSEDLLLAVPTDHPLASRVDAVDVSELTSEPIIMHSADKARYFYDLVVKHIDIDHQNVVHSVSQILTMVSLVAAGRGIAIVPESTVALNIAGVRYLPLKGIGANLVQLHAIWGKDSKNPVLSEISEALSPTSE